MLIKFLAHHSTEPTREPRVVWLGSTRGNIYNGLPVGPASSVQLVLWPTEGSEMGG